MGMHMVTASTPFSLLLAFGIPSGQDLIVLLVIVLLLFGANKLPELARGLGQSVKEFKKAKEEIDKDVNKSQVTTQLSTAVDTTGITQVSPSPKVTPSVSSDPSSGGSQLSNPENRS